MPFRRPTSPVSLEVCSPSADDIVSDGVLGSDDELDEDARDAQRQRIEKLAEGYLQGTSLFILSASLKGPFDQGWVNPWRKKRKMHITAEDSNGSVVQETDPRPRKQFHHELHESSCYAETSVAPSDPPSESSQVSLRHPKSRKPLDKQGRNSASVQGTPKRTVPWTGDAQLNSELHNSSIARPTDDNWLKRDRRRTGFRDFDPPTSPTITVSTRLSNTGNRRYQSIVPSPRPSNPKQTDIKEPRTSQIERVQETRRSESITESHLSSAGRSPIRQHNVPHSATHNNAQSDSSFCIVSSSSQLPKFEFRRRRKRSKPSTMKQSEVPSVLPETDKDAQQPLEKNKQEVPQQQPICSTGSIEESTKRENAYIGPSRRTFTSTAGSRAFDSHTASRLGLLESRTTHGTTENLPSAQPVPPNPAMADYAPSLHYTAPPTSETDDDDAGPVAPLSTQAALLHAQKSFQDGLESQVGDQPTTSSNKQRSCRSSLPSSTMSQKITPFHRINTPRLGSDNNPSRTAAAAVPSTQWIVDAVTPFTFSTEKKRHRHAHIESLPRAKSNNKKQKTFSFSDRSPSPYSDWSPSPERDQLDHRNQSDGESPHNLQLETNPSGNKHEPSQSTALPLTLSGTTPPTAQEGQGGLAGESFSLSQAIADAGSWLQESFDWNRELRRSGNNPGASSEDAQRYALNLDTH